jgi:hypothetical protein
MALLTRSFFRTLPKSLSIPKSLSPINIIPVRALATANDVNAVGNFNVPPKPENPFKNIGKHNTVDMNHLSDYSYEELLKEGAKDNHGNELRHFTVNFG